MSWLPVVSALGCAVRIEAGERSPDEIAAIARAWGDAEITGRDPAPAAHRTVPMPDAGLAPGLAALSQAVTLAAIEARRGELWMLHAGGVSDGDGNVVAIVGPSGRGKTTATRALARHYGYVTDETVGIAPDGTVLPYRKPLSILGDPAGEKAQRSATELGLGSLPPGPLRLSAIVILDRDPGGPDQAVLERCGLAEALPELVEQTSFLADMPGPLRQVAGHVAAVGGVHRVTYREAETLAAVLAPLFRPRAKPEPDGTAASTQPQPQPQTQPEPDDPQAAVQLAPRYWRGPYLDVIELAASTDAEAERLALLQPDASGGATLRIVDGIGPVLWRAADGRPVEELVDAAVSAHGAPPEGDADAAVAAALDALADEGVLAREQAWRVRTDVAWTANGEGFVALPLGRGDAPEPVALEGTAALVWSALTTARAVTAGELVRAISARIGIGIDIDSGVGVDGGTDGDGNVGIDSSAIDGDVRAFLRSLEAEALAETYVP